MLRVIRGGDQSHLRPTVCRGGGKRESHLAARVVADETDRIDRLARGPRPGRVAGAPPSVTPNGWVGPLALGSRRARAAGRRPPPPRPAARRPLRPSYR